MRKKIMMVLMIFLCGNSITVLADENIYEISKMKIVERYNANENDIPKEIIDDYNGMESIKKYKKKTDKKYEVIEKIDTGKYKLKEEFDQYDDAVKYIKKLNNKKISLINKDGYVIYDTNGIGRIVNLCNGKPEYSNRDVVKVYPNETSKNHITYINSGYIDDVPIIEYSEKRVKIQVNGVKGWIDIINSETVNGGETTNIVVIPMEEAKNLSYYKKNNNGDLVHYISSDVTTINKGNNIIVGKAPEFMNYNTKYYSYDSNYFYDNIEKLLKDMKANITDNSINRNNKYYNYFTYLPIRSKSEYSGEEINKYLEYKTNSKSVLRSSGSNFIEAQNKYGVNAGIMLGISINESAGGTSKIAIEKNNIFGLNAVDSNPGGNADKFETVKDCIYNFANGWMSKRYVNPKNWVYNGSNLGNKDIGINVQYASDPFWGEKASSHYYDLDKYLGKKDINNYQIGLFVKEGQVVDKDGKEIYKVLNSKNNSSRVGYTTAIVDKRKNNYNIHSDIQNSSSDEYNWKSEALIDSNIIKIINDGGWYIKDGYYHYKDHRGVDFTGWNLVEGKWYYFDENGKMQTGWQYIKDKWYYLYGSGEMATGWININREYYYLKEDGSMVTSWNLINEKWYYMEYSGEMKTGWIFLQGEYYYLNLNGDMQTGWLFENNKWYYLDEKGKMQTGWIFDGHEWYYAKNNGELEYKWFLENGEWYYFNESGIMLKEWLYDEGKWYYFDNSGRMKKGWNLINNNWYYMYNNGGMATNTIIDGWQINNDGVGTKIKNI